MSSQGWFGGPTVRTSRYAWPSESGPRIPTARGLYLPRPSVMAGRSWDIETSEKCTTQGEWLTQTSSEAIMLDQSRRSRDKNKTESSDMLDLIELLESFNRKERFFLISQAVGNFELSGNFRRDLGVVIGLTIPHGAFTAMDYHLEWLTAALYAHDHGDVDSIFDNPQQQVIRGNQEDTDLLVAFKDGGQYHLILVEAKGSTGWTNKQMRSKADRLARIFGSEGDRYPGVEPHICLASPRPPKELKATEWPGWMNRDDGSYYWLELKFPKERIMVTRCDANGLRSAKANHFRIIRA